jgi:hypothetical protein
MVVDSAWFFSTLAQVSATIIGFVAALTIGLYTLERQRRREGTDRLRRSLTEFEDKYGRITHFAYMFSVDQINIESEELSTAILEGERPPDTSKLGDTERIALRFSELFSILDSIALGVDNVLEPEDIIRFRQNANWLREYFGILNENNKNYYRDVMSLADSDQIPETYYSDSLVEDHLLYHRFDNKISKDIYEIYSTNSEFVASAENFDVDWSISEIGILVNNMLQDWQTIEVHASRSILNFEPQIPQIVRGSAAMTLFGVLFPLISLLTVPNSLQLRRLSDQGVLIVQISMLFLTLLSFVYLLYQLLIAVQEDTKI